MTLPFRWAIRPLVLAVILSLQLGPGRAVAAAAAFPTLTMPMPPGEHPRIVFTRDDLPRLRAWARAPEQAGTLTTLRWIAHVYHGAVPPGLREGLEKNDPTWIEEQRKQATGVESLLQTDAAHSALLALLTEDPKDIEMAVGAFRLWLSAYPPNDAIKPTETWGLLEWALAYDWVYGFLSPEERQRARLIFSSLLGSATMHSTKTRWYAFGPSMTNRGTCNWHLLWACRMFITCLALEGEPGGNPELSKLACEAFQRSLDDAISPEGAMYAGMQYGLGYGTQRIPWVLMALRLRGVSPDQFPHLLTFPSWISAEMLPWGGEAFPHNQSIGQLGTGSPLMAFLAHEGLGRSEELPGLLWDAGPSSLMLGILLSALPPAAAAVGDPPDLRLSQWFSVAGQVYCRSDRSAEGALFYLNTNPLGADHTHEDQGSFCLASHGAELVTDSGMHVFNSDRHNVVLIDGIGQGPEQARTESFIRSVDGNRYADVIDVDLRLAYTRTLQGTLDGPHYWGDFNPLEQADRRVLFVRGVTGPLVVIADDFRKDAQPHKYDWLLHTGVNNLLTCEGRTFRIRERFAGRYLRTTEKDKLSTFVAGNVPTGQYRGWALVRDEPGWQSGWVMNYFNLVGGRNTEFPFGRGGYRNGWGWIPLTPGDKFAGEIRVQVRSNSGGRVAGLAFTQDPAWDPRDAALEPHDGLVLLTADNVLATDPNPWSVADARRAVLDGMFLGAAAPSLSTKMVGTRVLVARVEAPAAAYRCLLAPHCEGDGRALRALEPGQARTARVDNAQGSDLVCAGGPDLVAAEGLEADGLAVVSLAGQGPAAALRHYALVNGRSLRYRGAALVAADAPVHVTNDGATLAVRGPAGVKFTCATLGATTLVLNGQSAPLRAGKKIAAKLPVLPRAWSVHISPDGRGVTVTGDGERPLVIPDAPRACNVTVNGVDRYFIRDGLNGPMYVSLEEGTGLHRYRDRVGAADLKRCLAPGSPGELVMADTLRATYPRAPVLASRGKAIHLALPTPGAALYSLSVELLQPWADQVTLVLNGKPVPPDSSSRPGGTRAAWANLAIIEDQVDLRLQAPQEFALRALRLTPAYHPLGLDVWSVAGPYPSRYLQPGVGFSTPAVKEAMETVYPPEQYTLEAPAGSGVAWKRIDPSASQSVAYSGGLVPINFRDTLPVQNSQVCYAATIITSPNERRAELEVTSDYWATAYLNGQRAPSDRPRSGVADDGAEFNTSSPYRATLKLRKGANLLLVKCHGGAGGNSFSAALTDPGDLRFAPAP
jgi:hypothetical protein